VIKSISLLTCKAGTTYAQFVKHWVEVHAPLALAVPGLRRLCSRTSSRSGRAEEKVIVPGPST